MIVPAAKPTTAPIAAPTAVPIPGTIEPIAAPAIAPAAAPPLAVFAFNAEIPKPTPIAAIGPNIGAREAPRAIPPWSPTPFEAR